jgi:DNA-binding NtrC family response regulator
VIRGELIRGWLRGGESMSVDQGFLGVDPIQALVGRTEREVVDDLLDATMSAHDGNRTKAAEVLGIGVRTLFNRLKGREQATR